MSLENPLWHYALALYSRPGVEQYCLQLQDQGASINRLLFACWLARQGVRLNRARLQQLDNGWRDQVARPLRSLRYSVRDRLAQLPDAESCYAALRQAELAAEQVELMLLWQTGRNWCLDSRTEPSLYRHNLELVMGRCDAAGLAVLELLCQSAQSLPPVD